MSHQSTLIAEDINEYLKQQEEKSMLRFITCGSVDDGKSTLIGRLLYDSKMIFEDQLASIRKDSAKHGTTGDDFDPALLTDGLKAEREQGITIDVAYRFFSTEKRKFIVADTPGHEQYTRNMATGASNSDLALVLVDARKGVIEQTRRQILSACIQTGEGGVGGAKGVELVVATPLRLIDLIKSNEVDLDAAAHRLVPRLHDDDTGVHGAVGNQHLTPVERAHSGGRQGHLRHRSTHVRDGDLVAAPRHEVGSTVTEHHLVGADGLRIAQRRDRYPLERAIQPGQRRRPEAEAGRRKRGTPDRPPVPVLPGPHSPPLRQHTRRNPRRLRHHARR